AAARWSTASCVPRAASRWSLRAERACPSGAAPLSGAGHGLEAARRHAALRRGGVAPLRGARLRLRPRVVEARLPAGDRGHHLRDRARATGGGARQPAPGPWTGPRAAPLAPRALARLPGVRRVRALGAGGDGAGGPAAA